MNLADVAVVGKFAPFFDLPCGTNPRFHLSAMGGSWIVLMFHGSLGAPHSRASYELLLAEASALAKTDVQFFGVSIDPADVAEHGMGKAGSPVACFQDDGGGVSRSYGILHGNVHTGSVFLLDRMLRIVAIEPVARMAAMLHRLRAELAAEQADATPQFAPVLTIPRIFEPELCRELIAQYESDGGAESGFMRDAGGKTVGMLDPRMKRRRDAIIPDGPLRDACCDRLSYRLIPAVARALAWQATRIERYIVACYSSEDAGFFKRHRDNTSAATLHRKFAVTLNLNAEDYEGGELMFPEFGTRTYKPPTGGATVFACGLLHEATPVTRGRRYAFLPFLYDEEGKRQREATIKLIVPAAQPEAAPAR